MEAVLVSFKHDHLVGSFGGNLAIQDQFGRFSRLPLWTGFNQFCNAIGAEIRCKWLILLIRLKSMRG